MLDFSTQEPARRPGKTCLFGAGSAGTKVMEEVLAMEPQTSAVCAMNLDARLLNASSIPCKLHLGARLTRGLGSGGDASLGAQAARESESAILRALEGCDLAVIAAGLGGGTGSGVAPEVARLAKEQGACVVSVVIRPFRFEGERRSVAADEALARLALYSDMVLRFDNDAMENLIDSEKGVLDAFSVVNALMAHAVLIVPSLLDSSSGSLLRVGLDDLLRVTGTGKGICSFGVGESPMDAPVEEVLAQVKNSPLFLEKRLREVDDVLVLVRGGRSLTLHQLEVLVNGMADMLGSSVRLHIGASVADSLEGRLNLTVLGVVPAEKTVMPAGYATETNKATREEPVLVPQENLFVGEGKTMRPSFPPPIPDPLPEPAVPSIKRNEHELEEELVPVRPSADPVTVPAPTPTRLPEEKIGLEGNPKDEMESSPDIKELEEGMPPAEGEEERAGHGLFAHVRPLILDGEDLDLPPALRKKKPDPS